MKDEILNISKERKHELADLMVEPIMTGDPKVIFETILGSYLSPEEVAFVSFKVGELFEMGFFQVLDQPERSEQWKITFAITLN